MTPSSSIPLDDWPSADRIAWAGGCNEASFLEIGRRPALQAASKRIVMHAYARWLAWLKEQDLLDDRGPAARIRPDRFLQFAKGQHARGLAPSTLANVLWAVVTAHEVMCPEADLDVIRAIARRASSRARCAPKSRPFIVHATEAFALGLKLMEQAKLQDALHDQYVDGLVIALMTSCPLRIGDFSRLRLGHNLLRSESGWRLSVREEKTAKGRMLPAHRDLTTPLDYYVQIVREQLLQRKKVKGSTDRFFVGSSGAPLSDQVMRRRIKAATRAAFGTAVLPHSFRKLAVTTLVMEAPEEAAFASGLLGHRDRRVTEDHYLLGNQILAARRYHESLEKLRSVRRERDAETIHGKR
jgi:integrase